MAVREFAFACGVIMIDMADMGDFHYESVCMIYWAFFRRTKMVMDLYIEASVRWPSLFSVGGLFTVGSDCILQGKFQNTRL